MSNKLSNINKFNLCKLVSDHDTYVQEVLSEYYEHNDLTEVTSEVKKYFENKWLAYGCFVYPKNILVGYCFIKNPIKRPETMTVVLSKYRNQGVARQLRDFAINDALKNNLIKGQYIYSAVEKWNIPSLISVLRSGYEIFRFEPSCEEGGTADNQFIQLHKKIR